MERQMMNWAISIGYDDVFKVASRDINVAYEKDDRDPRIPKNERQYVSDDERAMFDGYINLSVAELTDILAASLCFCNKTGTNVTFDLSLNPDMTVTALESLRIYIRQYIIERCKEQWYGVPQSASDDLRTKIRHTINLRRHSPSEHRKCRPLW